MELSGLGANSRTMPGNDRVQTLRLGLTLGSITHSSKVSNEKGISFFLLRGAKDNCKHLGREAWQVPLTRVEGSGLLPQRGDQDCLRMGY